MPRLIILIAIIAIALILWNKIQKASGEQRKKLIFWSLIGGVGGILAILALTGHLNIITAAIAGLVALVPRALSLLKYLPFISRLYAQNKQQNDQQYSQTQPPPNNNAKMTPEQAREILALKPGHSRDDVIQAHRRMMQKIHPDRGGSDYLAAQINKAKDTLLS